MLHDDAFTIYLEQISGKPSDERRKKVQEYPHPCSEDGGYTNVRRTLIKVGTVEEITRNHRCAIVVKPPRNFDLLGAEGLKVTVAIGHTQQEPHGLYGVQAWFIPASILFEKEEFEITDCWQWWYRYDFSDADDARKTRNRTPNAHCKTCSICNKMASLTKTNSDRSSVHTGRGVGGHIPREQRQHRCMGCTWGPERGNRRQQNTCSYRSNRGCQVSSPNCSFAVND